MKIGVVTGDDLLPRLDELIASGHALAQHGDRRAAGHRARSRALGERLHRLGADRRSARRAARTSSSPAARPTPRSRWRRCATSSAGRDDDWDQLAAGIVAGHIIECGAQCSGGNCLYDWRNIPDLANVGYPIVEAQRRRHVRRSRSIPNTGGRISVPTVTEQLVYEMGDPHSYITPDVIADFTTIQLEHDGADRVRVFGIKGTPPTDKLKVSIAYRAGFKAVGTLVYAWPDALEKAQLADRVLRERLDRLGLRFDQVLTEFVGVIATHGPLAGDAARRARSAAALRRARRGHARRSSASRARSRRSCSTVRRASPDSPAAGRRSRRSSPTGRRSIDKTRRADDGGGASHESPPARHRARALGRQGRHRQRRRHRARAASGIRCSREYVTRDARRGAFRGVITGDVERFELPNLNALNFLLHGALDGGGTLSLKTDAQGKVFSTALLRMVIDVPDAEARTLGLPAA